MQEDASANVLFQISCSYLKFVVEFQRKKSDLRIKEMMEGQC